MADPDAFLVLDPVKGFGFGGNLTGPPVTDSISKGAHGYNPNLPEMRSSLILSGAGIPSCKALEGATVEDIGPLPRSSEPRSRAQKDEMYGL